MAKLKLGALQDEKPVRLTIEVTATLHRDLIAYGEALGRDSGSDAVEPSKLIAPMLSRFMASDRGFARLKRQSSKSTVASS